MQSIRRTWSLALAITLTFGAASAAAQSARWQTVTGGDPQGDYVTVDRPVHEGTLSGARTVERIARTTGYTTGSITTIVVSGTEAEGARTITVHLPYGAELDLAQGDAVNVSVSSHLLGLGSVHEVRIARGTSIVVLQTSAARGRGVTVTRGAEVVHDGTRRQFAVEVAIGGHRATLRPGELSLGASMLMSGNDTIYEGGVRPPDAFDSRVVTAVRIRPLPPPLPPAATS
jgi:hypothetical protein